MEPITLTEALHLIAWLVSPAIVLWSAHAAGQLAGLIWQPRR